MTKLGPRMTPVWLPDARCCLPTDYFTASSAVFEPNYIYLLRGLSARSVRNKFTQQKPNQEKPPVAPVPPFCRRGPAILGLSDHYLQRFLVALEMRLEPRKAQQEKPRPRKKNNEAAGQKIQRPRKSLGRKGRETTHTLTFHSFSQNLSPSV